MLGTLAAIGSAFAGTKVYPIQKGGTIEMALAPAAAILPAVTAALKSATPKEELKTETTPLEKPEQVKTEPTPVENPEQVKTEPTPVENPEVVSPVELPSQEEPLPSTESVGGKKLPSWFKRKH